MYNLYLEWISEQTDADYVEGYEDVKASMLFYILYFIFYILYIFCTEYNLSFYVPKKNKCSKCESFDNLKEKTTEQDEEQTLHRRFADQCRAAKKKDKAMALLLQPLTCNRYYSYHAQMQARCTTKENQYYTI